MSPDGDSGPDSLQFWNVNVPQHLHTVDCPDYLEYAFTNDKDRAILFTPDAEYHIQSWPEVQKIIRDNRIDLFVRVPSDLRRYRKYTHKLKEDHGSVMNYVMTERLKWKDQTPEEDLVPGSEPFTNPDDFKILYNDWPYGIDPRIIHLVVWTKFELPSAEVSESNPHGDITPETRKQIAAFVDETFVSRCGSEKVIWFKNWGSLKSIKAVEHFHVMLFDPDPEFVKAITNGDESLAQKLKKEES